MEDINNNMAINGYPQDLIRTFFFFLKKETE